MKKHLFYQTGTLAAFILKKDRLRLPIWIISIVLLTIVTAGAFNDLYKTDQERQAIAETMKNPAMIAMVGPGYGFDDYHTGAMMAHQMLLFTALMVAVMSILLVSRHTRADEEDGRLELIRSLPTGRLANLSSTIFVMCVTYLVLAVAVGISLYALQEESLTFQGSLLYGAALGATGIFFTAITALMAQLSETSRGTISYSFAFLGGAYLLRAVGDVSNETLSWFSPLGWILGTETYVNNYWWPIVLTAFVSAVIMVVAFYLNSIRDVGSGFIQAKPGKEYATSGLLSTLGLPLHLLKTLIISWAIGMFVLGVSYGSVFGDLDTFFESTEMMEELLNPVEGFSLTEQFLALLMSIISMLCTIAPLLMFLKLRGEEKKGRLEHVTARAVSRTRIIGSYLVIGLVGAVVMQLLAMLGLWTAVVSVMEDPISLRTMFQAAIAYVPAMWVMVAIAAFLVGWAQRWTNLIWLYLGYSFFVVYLGGMLQAPEWMGKISPFGNVPQIPIADMNWLQIISLLVIALVVSLLGITGFRKRDLEG
ncbi:ABC transporter permease [Bacillus alkalisoli]|uniref:ABC transporter permease n=1 Tax=Bacillus alkalisoli TaxID=2011008 RepID=UPI000C23D8A2|nr:ABC transporter permease [Bacillus alkalisoli]